MNYGENISKVLLLLIVVIVGFAAFHLNEINQKSTKFYEYEKGKINLLQISKIIPRVEYYATLSQDNKIDINTKYSTSLNRNEIINIETFLATAKESEFYNIEITTYIMFDDQRVNIYKSPRYIKLPSSYRVNDYMLDILKMYGVDEFQYSALAKLKDKIFEDRDKFLTTVVSVAKLNRSDWVINNVPILGLGEKAAKFSTEMETDIEENQLDSDTISSIMKELDNSYNVYVQIK